MDRAYPAEVVQWPHDDGQRPVQLAWARCCSPAATVCSQQSLTTKARSHLPWEQMSAPGFTSANRRRHR
jgi:hypothetical protein